MTVVNLVKKVSNKLVTMDLNISEGSATLQFHKYLFNSRVQEVNETIEDFAKDLIRLGTSINANETQIVDRFIAGKNRCTVKLD